MGKIFTACSDSLSQSIGRGRINREGALDVRESRERRDKIVPNFSPEKRKQRNFGPKFSTFLSRIACCSRESRSVWQNFRQKQQKKKNIQYEYWITITIRIIQNSNWNWVWDFFSEVGVLIPFSVGNFRCFGRGKLTLGGGINSKTASQWPSTRNPNKWVEIYAISGKVAAAAWSGPAGGAEI